MRLFLAVSLPLATQQQLAAASGPLIAATKGLRPVPEANLHLTLHFLGARDEGSLPQIHAACARISAARAPFAITLAGAGAFPNARHAKVLFVGVSHGAAELATLAARASAEMHALGIPSEARTFHPHVTLARSRTAADVAPLTAALEQSLPALHVPVEALWLVRSHVSSSGSRYEWLQHFALRAR